MASTYTTNLGIEKIQTGQQAGQWGDTTNTNFDIIDQAVNGVGSVTLTSSHTTSGGAQTLPITDGAVSDGRNAFIDIVDGGDIGGNGFVKLTPSDAEKILHIRNSLSASRSVVVFQGNYDAGRAVTISNGLDQVIKFDGAGDSSAVAQDIYQKLGVASFITPTATINGGAIDNTVIGATTPAAGTFTTITASGNSLFNSGLEIDGGDLEIHTDQDIRFVQAGGGLSTLVVSQPDGTNYLQIGTTTPGTYYCRINEFGGITSTGTITAASFTSTGSATVATNFTVDTNTFHVDSTYNNVGIGTASPNGTLHVYGAASGNVSNVNVKIEAQVTNYQAAALTIAGGAGTIIMSSATGAPGPSTTTIKFPNLPTSDPAVAGQLWNDSGTLKISAG